MPNGPDVNKKPDLLPGASTEGAAENWFAAMLKPNGLNLAQRNLARQGFDVFVPYRLENARGKLSRRPLFPGYVFVQFDPEAGGWQAINSTRGIARLIVHDLCRPTALPMQFMRGLMARCDPDGLVLPTDDIAAGDRIRLISGPFVDLVTTVDSLDKDQRLRILIDLMGQKVRTSVATQSVEKLR